MLPNHTLSLVPIPGYYLPPDDIDPSKIKDYELGGIALQDPSQGLKVQVWEAYLEQRLGNTGADIWITSANHGPSIIFTGGNITEISFTFDQNMRYFLTYVESGQAKLYWYDAVAAGYVVTNLPVGARSPRCCLDDKRAMQVGVSDILLFYVRADNVLCVREQRDRYLVEYVLQAGVLLDVLRVGMTTVNRVQISIGTAEDPTTEINHRIATGLRGRITVNGDRRRIAGVSYV